MAGNIAAGAGSGATTGFSLGGPIGAGIGAVVGGGLAYMGGRKQEKENRRKAAEVAQEQARQRALREQLAARLQPEIDADISGQENLQQRLARERYEGLQTEQLSRSGELRRQAIVDRLARMGGATGRSSADITAPAAQAGLGRFEQSERQGLRDLAIRLAAQNAQRKEAIRQSALGRSFQLGQFQAGGYVPSQVDQTGAQIGAAGAELFGRGLEGYFGRRGTEGSGGAPQESDSGGGLDTYPSMRRPGRVTVKAPRQP